MSVDRYAVGICRLEEQLLDIAERQLRRGMQMILETRRESDVASREHVRRHGDDGMPRLNRPSLSRQVYRRVPVDAQDGAAGTNVESLGEH